MFKWPGTPSPKAATHELADFVELMVWRDGRFSVAGRSNVSDRLGENDYSGGVPEEDEETEFINMNYMAVQSDEDKEQPVVVGEEFKEIQRRAESCGVGYPFSISQNGQILRRAFDPDNAAHTIYQYLLLATRLNMTNNRVHGDLDGTFIFENLSAEVGRNYLGQRAHGFVFGTANQQANFAEKVNELCRRMGEGVEFDSEYNAVPRQQDGKLDVVAWQPFSDGQPGKLIIFGQCKTGTNYKDTLIQLQPGGFCKKWLRRQPILTPMRAFFITESLPRVGWDDAAVDAGLLFDRSRIIDFCENISADVLDRVATWTRAAAIATGLPDPAICAPR